ncbi:MAG: acetyl-CoA carboxylase carboxyltransferase subunit alpha [Firmicutes bacterium]|nr:acetyl-CoA carboxylase carboxyltransferase subunit alpha [Bacillota bacterium]
MSNASEVLVNARKVTRPTSLEFIKEIFDGFMELHGDRCFGDDRAIVGGIASLKGRAVTVIGVQKGHSVEENIKRNFGSPNPEGYRKALRLMKQAEKFNRPVVFLINTSGAYCGIGAEERGQGEAIAKCLFETSGVRTPIISIFIGEGGSGGAIALAAGDRVWMLDNGMYAVLSPEGFASILWRSPSRAGEAAELMKITAPDLLENGVIDKIIPEAEEGIENNLSFTANIIKENIIKEFEVLCAMDKDELLKKRYERFRKFGEFEE